MCVCVWLFHYWKLHHCLNTKLIYQVYLLHVRIFVMWGLIEFTVHLKVLNHATISLALFYNLILFSSYQAKHKGNVHWPMRQYKMVCLWTCKKRQPAHQLVSQSARRLADNENVCDLHTQISKYYQLQASNEKKDKCQLFELNRIKTWNTCFRYIILVRSILSFHFFNHWHTDKPQRINVTITNLQCTLYIHTRHMWLKIDFQWWIFLENLIF